MKDNISIIFAAIIGVFLIVILPLYSILDRQDSIAYNIVLTQTTNFVDNIRNNGFIDRDAYYSYLSSITGTSNSYKVKIEAYRKVLIPEVDETGKDIQDTYVEEIQLNNTIDIESFLEGKTDQNIENSNNKNNVYLLDVNDEIYVKVYNTNVTAGSIIYKLIGGIVNTKVIDISYGGVVNKINWELYDVINSDTIVIPQVKLSVPINSNNTTNILKIDDQQIECISNSSIDDVHEVTNDTYCEDIIQNSNIENYKYLYDLNQPENNTIKIGVQLINFENINVGNNITKTAKELYDLQESNDKDFNNMKAYVINNYLQLSGMYCTKDIVFRKEGDYYNFDIVLTNIRMASLDYLYALASVSILPGLGQDDAGIASIGAETVQIEITDSKTKNDVVISSPINFLKLQTTKDEINSAISKVYVNQEIVFVISYKGINKQTEDDIKNAIKDNLKIYPLYVMHSDIELYTPVEFRQKYNVDLKTTKAIVVKFHYLSETDQQSYIELLDKWIATNIEEEVEIQEGEYYQEYSVGAKSASYYIEKDEAGPQAPKIILNGELGDNGWYVSNVQLSLYLSMLDRIYQKTSFGLGGTSAVLTTGGSGVYKNTIEVFGANTIPEQTMNKNTVKLLNKDGISNITAVAYDYVGNVSDEDTKVVKIDTTKPTTPIIKVIGPKENQGWYGDNVSIVVTPGTDQVSGVAKTTIQVKGKSSLSETETTNFSITESGKNVVIARTYDKAGNVSETSIDVNVDKQAPQEATIKVISGIKDKDTQYYRSDVTVKISLNNDNTISGYDHLEYMITGDSPIEKTIINGDSAEITLKSAGTHNIIAYTYNKAGNVTETTYTVKIDNQSPNPPEIKGITGVEGINNWYISDVEVNVENKGYIGDSGIKEITYSTLKNGTESEEHILQANNKILLKDEGEYKLRIYAKDKAGNVSYIEKNIKIDKSDPISGQFKVEATQGLDDWYTSDISISSIGEEDGVSGIDRVEIIPNKITQDIKSQEVKMTTFDKAGRSVSKIITVKLDKTKPSRPELILPEPTSEEIVGVKLYNKYIKIKIIPGEDENYLKTTYKLTTNNGIEIVEETEGLEYTINKEGIFNLIATTYDKAGNYTTASQVIVINKSEDIPMVKSINGIDLTNTLSKTINSVNNKIDITLGNLKYGNLITITVINNETLGIEEIEFNAESEEMTKQITLSTKGKYSIKVSQKNIYGTIAQSKGNYYYIYE